MIDRKKEAVRDTKAKLTAMTQELNDFNKEHLATDNVTVEDENTDEFLPLASCFFTRLLEVIPTPACILSVYHTVFTMAYNALASTWPSHDDLDFIEPTTSSLSMASAHPITSGQPVQITQLI